MATYTKRGNTTRAQVCWHGRRISKSFPSAAEARVWATQREAEFMVGTTGSIPDKSFGELLERYAAEVSPQKRGHRTEAIRLAAAGRDTLALTALKDLDSRVVAAWRDRRLKAVSAASVRREWNLLSSACNVAVREWHWLRTNPFTGVRRPAPPQHRDRLARHEEMAQIQDCATTPMQKRVVAAALWAIETGMRAGEIVGLTAASVDLEKRVAQLETTKNGTRRSVPLSAEAVRIWREWGPFGLTSAELDLGWRTLCKKAGVVGLHFHDLRATAATRLSKKLDVLQLSKMLGHKDPRMLMIYYRESAEDVAKLL